MSAPDLLALTGAVERLSEMYPTDDPVFQQVVCTSVTMAEALMDRMDIEDIAVLEKLKSLQA